MTPNSSFALRFRRDITNIMNFIVLVLSVVMIVWISIDTFNNVEFMESTSYMNFQFWVCMFFILDFFVGLFFADDKWKYFRGRLLFLLLSIPYLNIIHHTGITLTPDALYFVRFIPLARGALAMAIVMGYLSSNAITSLFMSYIVIILMITYFCSLIFFQREYPVNPQINSYWTSLWWTCMYITTVGCDISPVTAAGKIIAVALPVCGMIMFPLFTVYLTNYVTRSIKSSSKRDS
ncbi:MAG: potassium channel family protein [Paramuribaculum sp.]|nr:potassium channel family protein [Paramuribaculum sp.]MDE6304182.1 potassium channel family protein [Paramuribaculum sp.]